ncbi:MAG: hypothetical protein AAB462_03515 [Patescibacteria group bacterium]
MDANKILQIKLAGAFNFCGSISAMSGVFAAQATAAKVLQQQMEPMRRALEVINEQMKQFAQTIKTVVDKIKAMVTSIFSWRPLIYVVPPAEAPTKRLDRHLAMGVDPHGWFIFGNKTVFRLHSRTSRSGRFLHKLFLHFSDVVSYDEIQEHIGSGDRKKAFKDLKYKLKQEGYQLDYVLVRTEGIALKGIVAI